VQSYNDTYHRSIGRAPSSVNDENQAAIHLRMYGGDDESPVARPKLKVGDKVRISKARRVFDKSYLPNWTEEIFTVTEVLRTSPVTYKLKDYGGEELLGSFYEWEVQRVVKQDEVYKIEKILNTRRRRGVKEYFVKWRGYPDKFNSWVTEADLV
jgi:phosphoenolpyruvate synthase/pyruvate phosphate dikinase